MTHVALSKHLHINMQKQDSVCLACLWITLKKSMDNCLNIVDNFEIGCGYLKCLVDNLLRDVIKYGKG